ncbi:nicotinate-nucleotide adenylyltransferase [Halalkalibacter urbisdiaboli]|uniref:nicotinate-nucleotide adenylyltransferase n=1 Tax=Halalkalibacter urbisdiaboli TaxID=1960589 RepID=UPI000B4503F4|nr:nicotinate-nucleotide adenylyltransferase [Halalkalibacter urbisdiaboli]
MKRIGLFGGTFDPPHLGHMLIAQEVLYELEMDEIWFVPVHVPPHKQRQSLTSGSDRIGMLHVATKDEPRFKVSTIEIDRDGKSYTVDTVKLLKEKYPEHRFFFLIGGDMIDYLPKWERIDELMTLVTFIGAKRPGAISKSEYSKWIEYVDVVQVDFSSTMIRERVRQGQPIRFMVPREVEAYIKERGLYGEERSVRNC